MKKQLLILAALFIGSFAFAQVGIGTENPDATLDVVGTPTDANTADGVLIPRISRADLGAKATATYDTAQEGTLIYVDDISGGSATGETVNVDATGFYFHDGSVWQKIGGAAAPTATPVRRVTANTTISNADFGGVILCEGGSTVTWPPISATFNPTTGDTVTLTAYGSGSVSNVFDVSLNNFGQSNPINSQGSITYIYFDNGTPSETGWYNINAL